MSFSDVASPTSHLTPPEKPEELSVPAPLSYFNQAADLLSPTAWMEKICTWALGFDPLQKAVYEVTGDWAEYAKVADVWKSLSEMCKDIADNIGAGNSALDATWTGHASDSRFVYFQTLQKNIETIQGSLKDLHDEYKNVCQGIWMMSEALKGCIQAIYDEAAIAAVEAAAGAALSWTGWGAAVGAGLVALQITQIIHRWGEATELLDKSEKLAEGSVGVVSTIIAGAMPLLENFPLPNQPYGSPATAH